MRKLTISTEIFVNLKLNNFL
jgi:ubiquitin-activating enzyme E1 C